MRLNEDSVGLLLQSCLGGLATDFHVSHLSRWMFRFSVSCKSVGLMVCKSKSFICKIFVAYFFLWVMVVLIGKKSTIFGLLKRKLNGPSLVLNLNPIFLHPKLLNQALSRLRAMLRLFGPIFLPRKIQFSFGSIIP